MLTELEELRKESQAYDIAFDRLVELNIKQPNKELLSIINILNNRKYLYQDKYEKALNDIDSICTRILKFHPHIIINRKHKNCYGVYIKNKKDIGVGIGKNQISAILDLLNKCKSFVKSLK